MNGAPISPDEADALFAPLSTYRTLVLAVSGGADSTALLHLAAAWHRRDPGSSPTLLVATVDHGLRANSTAEADAVADQAKALGLAHRTLAWVGPKPTAGIQAAARDARYRLLASAAAELADPGTGVPAAIVTAHTADDQAETLLMRLARGSGVDGLAAIPPVATLHVSRPDGRSLALDIHRPLLAVSRARLVATLAARSISYVDDPSNIDVRYERVRMRAALAQLQALGFSAVSLARTAARMQSAKAALEQAADALEATAWRSVFGLFDEIEWGPAARAADEIAVRLLRRSLARHGGDAPPAELAAVEDAHRRLFRGDAPPPSSMTLGGCIIEAVSKRDQAPRLRIYREPDRDGGPVALILRPGQQALWDRRFHVALAADHGDPVEVGPLGAGWSQLCAEHPGLAALSLPAAVARGLPVFRQQGRIIAVPALAALAREAGDETASVVLAGERQSGSGSRCTAVAVVAENRININPDLPADRPDKG